MDGWLIADGWLKVDKMMVDWWLMVNDGRKNDGRKWMVDDGWLMGSS